MAKGLTLRHLADGSNLIAESYSHVDDAPISHREKKRA